jgi:hypothetical protein
MGKSTETPAGVPNTGKRKGWAADDVVRLTITCNPKTRVSRKRFACYVDKCTVAEYTARCNALGDGNGKKAKPDLAWDTERCFIAVYPKGHPLATAPIATVRQHVKPAARYTDPEA